MERDINQPKEQQADLKKEAVAAAAKLPDFSYRPGGAWSINFGFEAQMRMLVKSKHGPQIVPEANGTIFARRYRFTTNYCVNELFLGY